MRPKKIHTPHVTTYVPAKSSMDMDMVQCGDFSGQNRGLLVI